MPGDKKRNSRPGDELLGWFTISYRTLAIIGGALIAVAAAAGNAKAFRMVCSHPENEADKVEKLYEAFLQAKQLAGEHTGRLSRSSFNQFVQKKTKELQKQKNCKDVEYVVETVDGQVKLKALVKA